MKNFVLQNKHARFRPSVPGLAIALALLVSNVQAATTSADDSARNTSGGIVGLAVLNTPAYLGSDQEQNKAMLPIDYRWANGAFIDKRGIGFNTLSSPVVQFGPLLNLGQERKEGSATALRGMGDVQANVEYGGFIGVHLLTNLALNMTLLAGSGADRNGGVISLSVVYKTKPRPWLELGLNVGANYANEAYMNTYFGVDSLQSKASGYNTYRLNDGLRDIAAGMSLAYQLAPKWFALGGVSVNTLSDAAKKSPIVRRSDGATAFLGLARAF